MFASSSDVVKGLHLCYLPQAVIFYSIHLEYMHLGPLEGERQSSFMCSRKLELTVYHRSSSKQPIATSVAGNLTHVLLAVCVQYAGLRFVLVNGQHMPQSLTLVHFIREL